MLTAIILGTTDFFDSMRPAVQKVLTDIIDSTNVCMVRAGGDSKDMIYYLLRKLSVWYPETIFEVLISDETVAYEADDPYISIFSLDHELMCDDLEKSAKKRDRKLLREADIVICRSGSKYDDESMLRKISKNPSLKIIVI